MTLSQAGDLNIVGNITGHNLNFQNGTWTPVLTSFAYLNITQIYATSVWGRYSIVGKTCTLYFAITFDIGAGCPGNTAIVLKGMPAACIVQNLGVSASL